MARAPILIQNAILVSALKQWNTSTNLMHMDMKL